MVINEWFLNSNWYRLSLLQFPKQYFLSVPTFYPLQKIFSMYIKHFVYAKFFNSKSFEIFFFHKYLPCPCTFSVKVARNSWECYRYFALTQYRFLKLIDPFLLTRSIRCVFYAVLYVPNPDYRLAALLDPAVCSCRPGLPSAITAVRCNI